jgi:hypothetical protein
MSRPPIRSKHSALTRRQVLQLGAAGAATLVLPVRRAGATIAGDPAPFLTVDEYTTLEAVTARILPTDALPGAREAGVADYIQALLSLPFAGDANCDGWLSSADLTAVATQLGPADAARCRTADANADGSVDDGDRDANRAAFFGEQRVAAAARAFAGGPFSGRQPFGDFSTGDVTDTFPPNSFTSFLPLNRLQQISWAVRLGGPGAVSAVADNPLLATLDDVDLRRKYRAGLAEIDAISRAIYQQPFAQLSAEQQTDVLTQTDRAFVNLVTGHCIEGLLCAPEYGGNRDLVGWQLIGFDGDSQPLGYTLGFDEATQQYLERGDKPNSKPNPNEPCAGFSTTVVAFLTQITIAQDTQPARRFRQPFCFEVSA